MDEYKKSKIDWIGNIPKEWDVSRIKYTSEIYTGNSISDSLKSLYEDSENAYPYISTKDIDVDNDIINYDNGLYTKKEDYNFRIAPKNSILLCIEGGSAGRKIGKLNQDVSFVNKLCCFNAKNINPNYLFFYLKSKIFKEKFNQHISGLIGGVSQSILKSFYIIVPPKEEQFQISNYLNKKITKLDIVSKKLCKQIEILEKYRKSKITEVITKGLNPNVEMKESGIDWIGKIPKHWEIKKIKHLGYSRNGLTYSPENIVEENEGILVLRSSNIQNGKLEFSDNVYVNCKIPDNLLLKKNDLLICSRNGSRNLIGKNALIDETAVNLTYGAFMCVYKSEYNRYIYYIFNSNLFDNYLNTFLTSTINQLTNSNLGSIKIPFTFNKKEQEEIINYLNKECLKIDEIIDKKRKQIIRLEDYKKSLIYEYVTGKKRINEG